jgi:hypothetical protein
MTTTDYQALRAAQDAFTKASLAVGRATAAVAFARLLADDRWSFASELHELNGGLFFAQDLLLAHAELAGPGALWVRVAAALADIEERADYTRQAVDVLAVRVRQSRRRACGV